MKKVLYISLLFVSILLVSCSKQDISPISDDTRETPTWNSSEKSMGDGLDTGVDDGEPSDGNEIVDPRFDPDGKGK